MQNIEEKALATYSETLPLWPRYLDDEITAVHKNKIDEFHEHLNKQNTSTHFTKEIEENFSRFLGNTRKQHLTKHTEHQHTLTDYLTKRLHTKRLRYGAVRDDYSQLGATRLVGYLSSHIQLFHGLWSRE